MLQFKNDMRKASLGKTLGEGLPSFSPDFSPILFNLRFFSSTLGIFPQLPNKSRNIEKLHTQTLPQGTVSVKINWIIRLLTGPQAILRCVLLKYSLSVQPLPRRWNILGSLEAQIISTLPLNPNHLSSALISLKHCLCIGMDKAPTI